MFKYYKTLISFRCHGDPDVILGCINPREVNCTLRCINFWILHPIHVFSSISFLYVLVRSFGFRFWGARALSAWWCMSFILRVKVHWQTAFIKFNSFVVILLDEISTKYLLQDLFAYQCGRHRFIRTKKLCALQTSAIKVCAQQKWAL